jgi:hypothetical protein
MPVFTYTSGAFADTVLTPETIAKRLLQKCMKCLPLSLLRFKKSNQDAAFAITFSAVLPGPVRSMGEQCS